MTINFACFIHLTKKILNMKVSQYVSSMIVDSCIKEERQRQNLFWTTLIFMYRLRRWSDNSKKYGNLWCVDERREKNYFQRENEMRVSAACLDKYLPQTVSEVKALWGSLTFVSNRNFSLSTIIFTQFTLK